MKAHKRHCETSQDFFSSESIEEQIYEQVSRVIRFCRQESRDHSFFDFEKALMEMVSSLGRLFIALFLSVRHEDLDVSEWVEDPLFRVQDEPIERRLKTVYGSVTYPRTYVAKKAGGGFHPLDAVLGLTRDGFSPQVISWVTRLATWVSFRIAARWCGYFWGWSPSTESIECLVLGLGRQGAAYMDVAPPPTDEGDVLVIELDGKATPTATQAELSKRRGKRKKKHGAACACGCQRHRGQKQRRTRKRQRRRKGDKSKNGRSITLVVIYTLKRGEDGRLHGPINKRVWGSYAPRKVMMDWARAQATKRGFPPNPPVLQDQAAQHAGTEKRVHIVIDGEPCLYAGMKERFPNASFALDIRHMEEKLWDTGRAFHKEGSSELEEWVEELKTLLYRGKAAEIVARMETLLEKIPTRGPGNKTRRETLEKLIGYMQPRLDMMRYDELIEQDLVIASGVVEGAARYVVGERMDCSGMRWIPERAEALLHLRCIEINEEWETFFDWAHKRWREKLLDQEPILIRTKEPIQLPSGA